MDYIQILTVSIMPMLFIYVLRKKIHRAFKKLKEKLIEKLLIFLFDKKGSNIISLAIEENTSTQKYWLINNVFTPLIILYLPYTFTLIGNDFQTIDFDKTILELTFTGAFTMIGINIMRTNLTVVNEELKNDILKDDPNFKDLFYENESLKSKLRSWIHILTIIGTVFYFMQVGGFIIAKNQHSLKYVIAITLIFIASVFFARILSVTQSNFAKNEDKLKGLFTINNIKGRAEYEDLKSKAEEGSLIE